jgi:hypothetical protein
MLIERAVRLMLRLELLDERLTHGLAFTQHDDHHYLAAHNSLTRTLSRLGIKTAVRSPGAALDDHLARLARQGRAPQGDAA